MIVFLKGHKMKLKYLSFIFPATVILLNGCGDTNQFETKPLKEVLNSHTWYEIDESKDLYAVHRFSNKKYQKNKITLVTSQTLSIKYLEI